MAVKLRLVRMGKKKQPTYRVVAADSRSPRDGRFLEIVGTYAPRGRRRPSRDAVVNIDNAKAVKWLRQGAQPTERVERLLRASGAWDEFTGSATGRRGPAAAPAQAEPSPDRGPTEPGRRPTARSPTAAEPTSSATDGEADETADEEA